MRTVLKFNLLFDRGIRELKKKKKNDKMMDCKEAEDF